MADAGAPGRSKRAGADAGPTRAPCCGLPSPLASAIRVTVNTRAAPSRSDAAASTSAPSSKQRAPGNG
ncbi:hypothetical protein [Lysobacter sp. CA199]|uniref:hypothetical protein n=1 Tax=Lysobacter sp. CA199 TaxID=3455608 RepID=UPI003F8D3D31